MTSGPELLGGRRTSTSTRCIAAGVDTLILGCTHYPLLTGVDLLRHGRRASRWSRAPRRPPRTSTRLLVRHGLERDPALPAPRAPVPDHRRSPRSSPAIGRRFLGPELTSVDQFAWVGDRMRLTVVGCSGSVRRPGLAGQLLPARGRARRAGPAGCCSTSAAARSAPAALRRPARASTRCCSATCTPTTASTSRALYVLRKYHPSAPCPPIPVWGPRGAGRAPAPTACEPSPGWRASSTSTEYDGPPIRIGPFTVEAVRVTTRSRPTPCGSRPTARAGLLRRHRHLATPYATSPHGADLLLPRRRSWRAATTRPALHMTGREAGELATEAGVDRLVLDPRPALARPGAGARRGASGASTAGWSSPTRAPSYDRLSRRQHESGLCMTRADGRARRRAAAGRHHPALARPRRRLGARRVRPHPGPVRSVGRASACRAGEGSRVWAG